MLIYHFQFLVISYVPCVLNSFVMVSMPLLYVMKNFELKKKKQKKTYTEQGRHLVTKLNTTKAALISSKKKPNL